MSDCGKGHLAIYWGCEQCALAEGLARASAQQQEIDALRAQWEEEAEANAMLVNERAALRAKLAESEAACTVLADAVVWMSGSPSFGGDGEAAKAFAKNVLPVMQNLPVSVRAHMEEDAALREVAKASAEFYEVVLFGPDPAADAHYGNARKRLGDALAHLDTVRAKGGG